jgi:hypothetical protein
MLDALIGGTTDPEILADLARCRMRAKIPALREALEGRFEPLHVCRSKRSSRTSTSSTRRSSAPQPQSSSSSPLSLRRLSCCRLRGRLRLQYPAVRGVRDALVLFAEVNQWCVQIPSRLTLTRGTFAPYPLTGHSRMLAQSSSRPNASDWALHGFQRQMLDDNARG